MQKFSSLYNTFNIIKQVPVFASLNWLDIYKIAGSASFSNYKKSEIIRREGDSPDFFYCIISGRLLAYTTSPDGKKENLDFIHRGMYFGILSTLTGEKHSMTFEALNDSVIMKIPKEDFNSILKSVPKLGVEFSKELSKRLRRNVKKGNAIFESQIISIYSPIKGIGSSTYAFNLAINLEKETRKKVIFITINPKEKKAVDEPAFNDKGVSFKADSLVDLNEGVDNSSKIFESIVKEKLNIDVLGVSFAIDDSNADNKAHKKIAPFISTLVGDYHYVVVDLPNHMDDIVLETLAQSDRVHLLSSASEIHLVSVRKVIDTLEKILKGGIDKENVKVIISNIKSKEYLSFEEINKSINYHVHAMLPFLESSLLKSELLLNGAIFHKCPSSSEYEKIVRRLSREIGKVLVGLVLGGGAALGLAHIGVIRVLEKENIPIDIVIGSSMGALIGALWVTGHNADEMAEISKSFENKGNLLKLLDPVMPISGVIGGHAIKSWIKRHIGSKTFYNTTIPLKVVAYDLLKRQEIVLDSGNLIDAVRKSISIPGVIEPIKSKEQLIIDGGVLNPLPTNILASLGIKKIISVNVLKSPDDVAQGYYNQQEKIKELQKVSFFKAPLKFLGFRISKCLSQIFFPTITDIIVMTLQASEYMVAEQSAEISDVNIHPDLQDIDWYELYRVNDIISRGETAALEVLVKMKSLAEE